MAGVLALKISEPLTVAFADSVIVALGPLTARIVVPDGIPVPVTICPAMICEVLLISVTDAEPLLSVPVTTKGWTNQGGGELPGC